MKREQSAVAIAALVFHHLVAELRIPFAPRILAGALRVRWLLRGLGQFEADFQALRGATPHSFALRSIGGRATTVGQRLGAVRRLALALISIVGASRRVFVHGLFHGIGARLPGRGMLQRGLHLPQVVWKLEAG